jgi:hypothetical protein
MSYRYDFNHELPLPSNERINDSEGSDNEEESSLLSGRDHNRSRNSGSG